MTDQHSTPPRHPRVWLEGRICRIDFGNDVRVDRQMVDYIFQQRLLLMRHGGERQKLLVTTSGRVAGIDYDASILSVSRRITETVAACAVVTPSPAIRMVAAPFVLMFQPRYPVRLFPDETTAREWLDSLPGENNGTENENA